MLISSFRILLVHLFPADMLRPEEKSPGKQISPSSIGSYKLLSEYEADNNNGIQYWTLNPILHVAQIPFSLRGDGNLHAALCQIRR
jgi:hypothetical protein